MVDRSQQSETPRSALAALRAETKVAHDRLHVHPLMKVLNAADLSLDAYRNIIEAFHGFYAGLEPKLISAAAHLNIRQEYDHAVRTGWLIDDLRDLGRSTLQIDALPVFDQCITVATLPQFAGCQYVIQGSTLGGASIVRMLGHNDHFHETSAIRFFRSYGEQVIPRWRRQCDFIDMTCSSPHSVDEAVSTALEIFSALDEWLSNAWHRGTSP